MDNELNKLNEQVNNQTVQPVTEQAETPVKPEFKLPTIKLPINLVILLLALITVALLLTALSAKKFSPKQQAVVPTPTPAAYVQSNLSLSSPQKNSNGVYSSNVEISTGNNQVTGVQIDISYDPTVLTNVDIKTGSFFTNPTVLSKKIDAEKGILTYTLFVNPAQKSVSGSGTVAVLSFSTLAGAKTPTKINLLPTSEAVAMGQFESVLKTATGTILALK
jgi:hypothetical protein